MKKRTGDWDRLFKPRNYKACVDWPTSRYYKDLLKKYPNAKVILTVRDPEKWYQSVYDTIYGKERLKKRMFFKYVISPIMHIPLPFRKPPPPPRNDNKSNKQPPPPPLKNAKMHEIMQGVIWGG